MRIRIGLNSGSLPHNDNGKSKIDLMVDTALEYISWFENLGFYNTVVSMKASDSTLSYEAARLFASKSDYPMHLGVTEAGGVVSSCVKSTWTLGRLLEQGITDCSAYSLLQQSSERPCGLDAGRNHTAGFRYTKMHGIIAL